MGNSNKTVFDIAQDYLNEMSVSLTESTLKLYRTVLTDFARTCKTEEASKPLVIKHVQSLKDRGNSANTIRTKLTMIKGFSKWTVQNGYYNKDFAASVRLPAPEYHVADRMNRDEVVSMLHSPAPKYARNFVRNKALLELAIVTAGRVSSLCALKRNNVDLENRTIKFEKTKRNKELEMPLTESLAESLTDYIENFRPLDASDDDPLFIGERTGQNGEYLPLTRQQVFNITKAWTERATGRALSPHKLRHTSATMQIESGKLTLDEISKNLGHSSVAVTQRYAQRLNDTPRRTATVSIFEGI